VAYGPRPGDVDRVAALGALKWIDQQLDPDHRDNRVLTERERAFTLLSLSVTTSPAPISTPSARVASASATPPLTPPCARGRTPPT